MADLEWLPALKDLGLFLLALYGAVLATFNWRQAHRREQRKLKVRLSTMMPTIGADLGPPFAQVEAVNVGHRPVTIDQIALELPDGRTLVQTVRNECPGRADTILPTRLDDGQSAHLMFSYENLARALLSSGRLEPIDVTAICTDSTGAVHRGDKWTIDPAEFLRMATATG